MIPALNLLPADQKKDIKYTRTFLLLHEILLFAFIAVVISSALMLTARIMLENKFQSITIENIPGATRVAKLNRDITRINQQLTQIKGVARNYVKLSALVADLSDRTPQDVNWHTFQILENNKILITGVAQNRDSLIAFQSRLEQSPYIRTLDLPLQYLTAGKDNPFKLEITFESASLSFPL